jgi:Protein of unknown function (DUF1264).
MRSILYLIPASLCLTACGDPSALPGTTVTAVPVAAAATPVVSLPADASADGPLAALGVHLDGFHFFNGDLDSQVEAHHYCSVVDADVRQCVIFDGSGRGARLLGVEYVVSRRAFERLPHEERKLWHSHAYDVTSGTLVAPELSSSREHGFMTEFVGTYGKAWHTWHDERQGNVPLGHPMLMAAFTGDGQADAALLSARDERLQRATAERRAARADIAAPVAIEGADAWQHGDVLQLTLRQTVAKSEPPGARTPSGRDEADPASAPTRRIRSQRLPQMYAALPPVDMQ